MILSKIVEQKKLQLSSEMSKISIEGWKQRMRRPGLHKPLDFYEALRQTGRLALIAEIKKASPSKGIIREDFDPLDIAREYMESGVDAISVLTEPEFFKGSDDYLVKIRQLYPMPILRKDFIINVWQIYQTACLGADAILLIVSILTDEELRKFMAVSSILGLSILVEVHDRQELSRALEVGAKIIGINNRNLKTFHVDIKNTETLMNAIPRDTVVVSESGISSNEDIKYLKELGVNAVLIGEVFMRASSIKEKIKELMVV